MFSLPSPGDANQPLAPGLRRLAIAFGHKLELAVIERDPRCKMITLDPDTADESPKLLQHVSRNHGGDAGVFAAVLQEGRVKKGDSIYLL